MLNGILLSGSMIKVLSASILVVLMITVLVSGTSLSNLLMVQVSLLFFAYNLLTIVLLSSDSVGILNAIGAFLYNYSLLLFVLPYFWIAKLSTVDVSQIAKTKMWVVAFIGFAIIVDVYGLIEFTLNDYLLPVAAIAQLENGDYIKFDHIEGFIRVSSLFKSPLEFGIFNVLVSGVALAAILSRRNGVFIWLLLLVSSAGVFITISRTAILMYFCNISLVTLFFFMMKKKTTISKRALWILCFMLFLGVLSISIADLGQFFSTSTNSSNFEHRIEIWGELLSKIGADPWIFWFGLGAVQNGSYGGYHEIQIENIYLGAIVAGGMIGLLLFMAIFVGAIADAWGRINKLGPAEKIIGYSLLSFFLAFLVGGLTENMMHIMFYPFVILLLVRIVPQNSAKNKQKNLSV